MDYLTGVSGHPRSSRKETEAREDFDLNYYSSQMAELRRREQQLREKRLF